MKAQSSFRQFLRKTKRSLERNLERFAYRRRLKVLKAQAEEIVANHSSSDPVFLFAPGLSWNRQLVQRPQQLARALAGAGCLVFYLEPRLQGAHPPFSKVHKNLYWANVPVDAFETIPGLWLYQSTWSIDVSPALRQPKFWYDVVDDLTTFEGDAAELARNHQERLKRAHLVTVTARKLHDEVSAVRPDAILSPNAVDFEHFSRTPEGPPADLKPILAAQKPVIGYHGAFDRWFDYELLRDAAQLVSGASFVLIGPDVHGHLQRSGVLSLENVHWLGEKAYESLPNYLFYFDAAIIPFILSPITHATSPIKMFEYMAMGKPIVATAMEEVKQYPEVMIGSDQDDFIRQIQQALSSKDEPETLQRLFARARENSWQNRAEEILRSVHERGTAARAPR